MKLQSLGIVFIIIILPMIIVLTYFIQLQIDTIALQTSYDSKLMDATYDALNAFEVNTANEDLSGVSDSLRGIIEASNNVFFNTLSTNFGMSNATKLYMQSYVPAVLYTLYDGYYIYSPTKQPKICVYGDSDSETWATANVLGFTPNESKNGQPIYVISSGGKYYASETGELAFLQADGSFSTDVDNAKYKTDYMLKSYMPYSARYIHNNIDVVINYTLDNYINVEGNIGDIYYTKTGYLVDPQIITSIKIDDGGNVINNIIGNFDLSSLSYNPAYNEETAERFCMSGEHKIEITLTEKDLEGNDCTTTITSDKIIYNGKSLSAADAKETLIKAYDDYQNIIANQTLTPEEKNNQKNAKNQEIQDLELGLENMRAVTYYIRSTIFSRWIFANLKDIEEKDIQINSLIADEENFESKFGNIYSDFKNNTTKIFALQNPDSEDSNFANHKDRVIRNSIQYNLNLAFSVYSDMSQGQFVFEMPVLKDEEWAKIISRVSVVSFLQGVPCGTKMYSNYSLVYSSNNEVTVIPDEIYYVPKNKYNDEVSEAHRIECSQLEDSSTYIAFTSKELKYDKIYNKNIGIYEYDHKNLSCYNCIINKNYDENYSETIDIGKLNTISPNRLQAYFKAVGALRQNLYKTNALPTSEGFCVNYKKNAATGNLTSFSNSIAARTSTTNLATTTLKLGIGDVKRIEVVLYGLSSNDMNETTVKFTLKANGQAIGTASLATAYYSNTANAHPEYVRNQTISLEVDPALFSGQTSTSLNLTLERDDGANKTSTLYFDQTYVNIIYK